MSHISSVSPVFERMFEGDFEEAVIPDNIVLDDVSGSDFKRFIEYLYWHDNRRLDSYDLSTVQTLIYLSKKFMVNFMTANCISVIKRRLSNGLDADVTIDLYEYAHQLEEEGLLSTIRSVCFLSSLSFAFLIPLNIFQNICLNADVYINTSAVFDLSSDVFLKFIEEFQVCVSDKIRFDVIHRYCKIHGLILGSSQTTSLQNVELYHNDDVLKIKRYKETPEPPTFMEKYLGLDKETQNPEEKEKVEEKPTEKNGDEKNEEGAAGNTEKDPKKEANEREERTKEEYIGKLLKTIKFTSMSAYDFCSGPGASELLTIERKYELLSAICIAEHKMSLLARF